VGEGCTIYIFELSSPPSAIVNILIIVVKAQMQNRCIASVLIGASFDLLIIEDEFDYIAICAACIEVLYRHPK